MIALYVVPIATETSICPVNRYAVIMLTAIQMILQVIDLTNDLRLESIMIFYSEHICNKY